MIVVDANVIAYLLIAGAKTADAQAAYERDSHWVVPDLWRDEFLNVLATYVRQGGATLPLAQATWQAAEALFAGNERRADPQTVLEVADRFRLSAYNAQYLAIALESGVGLLTEERALRQSAPQHTATIREFITTN